jgi:hypothetical protein
MNLSSQKNYRLILNKKNNKISGNLKLEKYLFFYFFELIHFLAFSNASNHGETSSFLPSG